MEGSVLFVNRLIYPIFYYQITSIIIWVYFNGYNPRPTNKMLTQHMKYIFIYFIYSFISAINGNSYSIILWIVIDLKCSTYEIFQSPASFHPPSRATISQQNVSHTTLKLHNKMSHKPHSNCWQWKPLANSSLSHATILHNILSMLITSLHMTW